jgi:hypothetical protein
MARNSLRDGWRVLMRAPESIAAEIAWRWAFGAAFWVLLFVSFHQYFSHVEISSAEYALLKSLEPFTWIAITARAMQAFVAGLRELGPILFPALAALWLALATIGRAVTIRALVAETARTNWISLLLLNAFRFATGCAALLAYFGLAAIVSRAFDPREYYAATVVLLLAILLVLAAFWGFVNWFASLAQIFAAGNGAGTLESFRSAIDLYQAFPGALMLAGFWFGFARLVLLCIVTVGSLSPAGNMTLAGLKGLLIFIAIISLLYFAAADALNMWRLGVYISLTEPERTEPVPAALADPNLPAPETVSADTTPQTETIPLPASDDWKPIAES